MKKHYKYIELILALRFEYMECKRILDELNKCVCVKSEYSNFHFSGGLSSERSVDYVKNKRVRLCVEKHYQEILKKIQYLIYDWYSIFLYSSSFDVIKNDKGAYCFQHNNIASPVDRRRYIPEIEIIDLEKFSTLIDELFATDLMNLSEGCFGYRYDNVNLHFDEAWIHTRFGIDSHIGWSGLTDSFDYRISKGSSHNMLEDILTLEMPADKISNDWLGILEKHKDFFDKDFLVWVEFSIKSRNGILQIDEIREQPNSNIIKLSKKPKVGRGC